MSHEVHRDFAVLLLGPATAALAADPAAGQKIFKAQCGVCHAVEAGQNRIGPTLFAAIGLSIRQRLRLQLHQGP